MHNFYNKLSDQIATDSNYSQFNGKPTIHDALMEISEEYRSLTTIAQCLTSHCVWSILHDRQNGKDTIDYDAMTANVYTDKISEAELRSVDFDYYYFELDPSTSDFQITTEMGDEVCVANIRDMLNDGVIDSPLMNGIHTGLVKLGHIQTEDILLIKELEAF